MATSGSYDWTLTRNQVITQTLENLGVIEENETPSSEQIEFCSTRLNGVVKTLQHKNIFLWSLEWVTQTISASSAVTSNGNTYRCIRGHTSTATDQPETGANWSTYWVLDNSATSGGAWALSTSYTTAGEFSPEVDTIGINKMFIRDGGNDYPIDIITMGEYMDIMTKSNEGKPSKAVFDRQLTPKVYLYKQPDATDYVIHYQKVRKLEDFDAISDNFDGPESYLPLLIKLLEEALCAPYRIPLQERAFIKAEAREMLREAKRDNNEPSDGEFIKGAFS